MRTAIARGRRTWLALTLACATPACATEGELDGSLSDAYRIGHDDVRARLYPSELAIEYARDDGSVPVRVSLNVREAAPRSGEKYDLGEVGAITGQTADGTEIPTFIDGELKLDTFENKRGGRVVGSFKGTFDGVRDTLGLEGTFDTTLELIDWPVAPDAGMADDGEE